MDITRDPSNPIDGNRYFNIPIVDDAGIFNSALKGLLPYPIDGTYYIVLLNNITLFIYTSISERNNWQAINLSSNQIAVFIFKYANKLHFRIKLADNLFLLSRFYPNTQQMFGCEIILEEKEFIGKKLSIEFILRLFDTVNEPLFNIITKEQIKSIQKSIKITKKGVLKPVIRNPIPDKLNITIGLFFDGTGNNKFNTKKVHDVFANLAETQNELFSEVIDDYRLGKTSFISEKSMGFEEFMFKPKSSYLNNYSNISRLFDNYKGINIEDDAEIKIDKDKENILKLYIEGVGTKQGEEDSNFGSGLGRDGYEVEQTLFGLKFKVLRYGVMSRCIEAIQKVSDCLLMLQEKESIEIGEVIFDIFGFSRGAAAARLFYRKLFRDNIFNDENYKNAIKIAAYKIRFYGLFETVLSISDSSNEEISLQFCDSPCYHIIAQDEKRENFPLVQVDAKNCIHLEIFGCHSDIGGSYTKDKFDATFAYKESEKNEPSYDLKKLNTNYKLLYAVDTTKKYLKSFVNQFAIKYKQIRIVTESELENQYNGLDANSISTTKFGYVAQEFRIIESDASTVALNAMLSFALQHNLPFSEGKKEFNPKLSPKDKITIENYNDKVQKLIDIIANSNNASENLDDNDYFNLYNRFIHISESYGYQIWSDKFKSKIHELNKLYSDRPAKDHKRAIALN